MNIFKNIKNGIKATTPKEKKVVKGQDLPVISRILKNFAMDKDKGVIGGYNNSFPLSTATQGNVYFLPATGKYYYCQTSYNGTQISAPNSNFVEISVLANHDRLNNLVEINGINKLSIRIGTAVPSSPVDKYTDVILDVPFENKCLFAIGLDNINYTDDTPLSKVGIDTSYMYKDKIRFIHDQSIFNFLYCAIGY